MIFSEQHTLESRTMGQLISHRAILLLSFLVLVMGLVVIMAVASCRLLLIMKDELKDYLMRKKKSSESRQKRQEVI